MVAGDWNILGRWPNEFGKEQEITNVGNFLAARALLRFVYANPEEGNRQSEFQWNDTTLFYAGAVTKNISAFAVRGSAVGLDGGGAP